MIQKRKTDPIEDTDHELSIQVGLNGLSFCIRDGLTHQIKAFEQHSFSDISHPEVLSERVKTSLQENEKLKGSFKHVVLIHENELSSFVPEVLFDDKQLSDYLKFNVKILENDFITYDRLTDYELINVYIPYVNVNNVLFEHFGTFKYHHFSSILVRTILDSTAEKAATAMYVNVQKTHFEIVVIDHQKLSFYNSFFYTTKEDFVYYILFTAQQLDMDPEIFPLYLIGSVDKNTATYQLIYKYIKNVFFFEKTDTSEEKDITQSTLYNKTLLLNSF